MRSPLLTKRSCFFLIFTLIWLSAGLPVPVRAAENEESYSISLTQTAEVVNEVHEIEGKKVITETYSVREGDYVWRILRKRGLLEKKNFQEIISLLKKLNPDLKDMNLIHPGESILIPLVISPLGVDREPVEKTPSPVVPVETLKDMNLEFYTVNPGDSLIKVVKGLYDIPEEDLHNEYLSLLKKMNPSIRDLNRIYPGQKVRIPIYSPKVVRKPIKPDLPEKEGEAGKNPEERKRLSRQLKEIFTRIGEEWVHTGKHFIPLKTGGEIHLNAESYPVLELRNGRRVVVDLNDDLPARMDRLITSNWENYRIVHIEANDTLKACLTEILSSCDYEKVYNPGEPLALGGDVPVRITADFIIRPASGESPERDPVIVVNLFHDEETRTPPCIQSFLEGLGVKLIDYPPLKEASVPVEKEARILESGGDASSLIESLLSVLGTTYSSNVEIPVYQNKDADFTLSIQADFLLNRDGREYIIDLGGLDPEIVQLLKEHNFSVLSIPDNTPHSLILTKTLDFLGVGFDSGTHSFQAMEGAESKKIELMIRGIVFRNSKGQPVIASPSGLSSDISRFLDQKGYRVFRLSQPMDTHKNRLSDNNHEN